MTVSSVAVEEVAPDEDKPPFVSRDRRDAKLKG